MVLKQNYVRIVLPCFLYENPEFWIMRNKSQRHGIPTPITAGENSLSFSFTNSGCHYFKVKLSILKVISAKCRSKTTAQNWLVRYRKNESITMQLVILTRLIFWDDTKIINLISYFKMTVGDVKSSFENAFSRSQVCKNRHYAVSSMSLIQEF